MLGPQTPTSITIRQEEGKELAIRRGEIRAMRTTSGKPKESNNATPAPKGKSAKGTRASRVRAT